jgi:hypothetical protein
MLASGAGTGCTELMCDNEVVAVVPAPDRRATAIAFTRNCGATTGYDTQVSVVAGDRRTVSGSGNIWVADDSGVSVRAAWGGPPVSLMWLASDTLEVRYRSGTRVFRQEERAGEVTVRFTTE